jgi:hypothetical protein
MPREESALIERVLAWWYGPAPAARLALLRIASGGFALVYLLIRVPNLLSLTAFHESEFRPVGIVSSLAAPLPAWLVQVSVVLAILSGFSFVLGLRFKLLGPVFAGLLWWLTSYRSSWGMIFHTDNLLTLHVLLLSLSPAADVLSWDARRQSLAAREDEAHGRYGWAIRTMLVVTACTYVVAGIAKLKLGGWEWLGGELLRSQIAFDNLRKIELGSSFSSFGVWMIRHPSLFAPLAAATLLVELGAPLALRGGRVALVWCGAAWSFHIGIALMMNIGFPYQLSFIAYLPAFRVERVLALRGQFLRSAG